jgi:hypothetical protein
MDKHTGFFEHFACDRIFEAFARLDEAGKRGIAACRPARLTAKQGALPIAYENDHRGIDAWKGLLCTGFVRAAQGVTCAHRHERGATGTTIPVA